MRHHRSVRDPGRVDPGGIEAEVALFASLDELMVLPKGALKGKIAEAISPD